MNIHNNELWIRIIQHIYNGLNDGLNSLNLQAVREMVQSRSVTTAYIHGKIPNSVAPYRPAKKEATRKKFPLEFYQCVSALYFGGQLQDNDLKKIEDLICRIECLPSEFTGNGGRLDIDTLCEYIPELQNVKNRKYTTSKQAYKIYIGTKVNDDEAINFSFKDKLSISFFSDNIDLRFLTINFHARGINVEKHLYFELEFIDKNGALLDKGSIAASETKDIIVPNGCSDIRCSIKAVGKFAADIFGIHFLVDAQNGVRDIYTNIDSSIRTRYDYINRIKVLSETIQNSNGSKYYKKAPYNIGIITDLWHFNSWKDTANFVYITQDNWEAAINDIDMLVMYSAWRGIEDNWIGIASSSSPKGQLALDIIKRCNEKGIRTAFMSGEDPVHYNEYLPYAKMCKFIFTSCAEKIADYRSDCINDNVYFQPFVFNPLYHNPIGCIRQDYEPGVMFAGSWYKKYANRCADTKMLFDGVISSGTPLIVIDRCFSLGNLNHIFPEHYNSYIYPDMPHELLQKVHKLFQFSLNLNTITSSNTMFANRVCELLSMGCIVLSNYSMGMANSFPTVKVYVNKDDIAADLKTMDDYDILDRRMAGIRIAYKDHCVFDVITTMLAKCGFSISEKLNDNILVVTDSLSDSIRNMFGVQSYLNKTLILSNEFEDIDLSEYAAVTYWNSQYTYGQYYLEDMFNAFKYTDSDYVTKSPSISHDYVQFMHDKYSTMFWAASFTKEQLKQFGIGCKLSNGYSIDSLNLTTGGNTYKTEDTAGQNDYQLTVIMPIFNNGLHLKYKGFASLKRSSIFNQMRVLLIDDGSTDEETVEIIKGLVEQNSNTEAYFFPAGGSGSASRARNKGMDMVTSDYMAFLDPDNEAIMDAYSKLYQSMKLEYKKISNNDNEGMVNEQANNRENCVCVDFAVGEVVILGRSNNYNVTKLYMNYSKTFKQNEGLFVIPDDGIVLSNFNVHSQQGMVICTDFIKKNNLRYLHGLVGEDTFFYMQMLHFAKYIICADIHAHIYYNSIETSVTNTVNADYFSRAWWGQSICISWLSENGYIEHYLQKRFPSYFVGWYCERLIRVYRHDMEEFAKSAKVLRSFLEPLIRTGWLNDKRVLSFYDIFRRESWNEFPLVYFNL